MKLFNSLGPNPRAVRMFIAELGIEVEMQEVDIMSAENRGETYLKVNPGGQCPALELDDGSVIAEITAICEYLEETQGAGNLLGNTAEKRAETRMWVRRIDHGILENLSNGFRYSDGADLFRGRMRLIPQAADDLKTLAQEKITWLNDLMDGKDYICGDRFSMADVLLFAFLDFFAQMGQPIDPANANIVAWYERIKERPSAAA